MCIRNTFWEFSRIWKSKYTKIKYFTSRKLIENCHLPLYDFLRRYFRKKFWRGTSFFVCLLLFFPWALYVSLGWAFFHLSLVIKCNLILSVENLFENSRLQNRGTFIAFLEIVAYGFFLIFSWLKFSYKSDFSLSF